MTAPLRGAHDGRQDVMSSPEIRATHLDDALGAGAEGALYSVRVYCWALGIKRKLIPSSQAPLPDGV